MILIVSTVLLLVLVISSHWIGGCEIRISTMAEMHLDLCIQSTTHLLETISIIKENVRILEVFLNSGLTTVEFGEPTGLIGDDYFSGISEGRKSTDSEGKFYHLNYDTAMSKHSNCCCVCRFRLPGRKHFSGTASRASAATSFNSGTTSNSKKKVAPIITPLPRLNKTASLRREMAQQRARLQSRKNSFL